MPTIIDIADPEDLRVAMFRAVRERDVVGREGGFIAEGEVVLWALARSRLYAAQCLLIAARRVERLGPMIERFPAEVPVYRARQEVMDAIAGFAIHRGVLAFGRRGPSRDPETLLAAGPEAQTVLALFGISNHDNLGGIFRNAAAFGVAAILLDGACCDPLYRKAIRVSVGAALNVPFARLPVGEDAIDFLRRQGFTPLALSPAGAAALADLGPQPPRLAVLFGAEGHGLPPTILRRAATVAIPMAQGFDSLNVATTSGIVLHHLGHARRQA